MLETSRAIDRGSGSVVAVGLISAILALVTVCAIPLNSALSQTRLQIVADNTAIAAADALRGLVAGAPCDVARSFQKELITCQVIGGDVRIELREGNLTARARAGEP